MAVFSIGFLWKQDIEILKEVFEKELLKQKVNPHQMLLRSLVNNNTEAIAVDPNSEPLCSIIWRKIHYTTQEVVAV